MDLWISLISADILTDGFLQDYDMIDWQMGWLIDWLIDYFL